jgi:hypothetical protein
MAGREKRKRRRKHRERRAAGPYPAQRAAGSSAVPTTVGEAKRSRDDLAREQLVPLDEGERPRAVTIAAIVAALLALSNLVGLVAGVDIRGNSFPVAAVLPQVALMLAAAVGMWYSRYWAVLGFQVILGFLIVYMSLLLMRAQNALAVAVALAILAGAGTLFWFLIQSLARIQMPERRPPT